MNNLKPSYKHQFYLHPYQFLSQTYKDGESFKDDCNNCSCVDGKVQCTLIYCGDPSTDNTLDDETSCVYIYKGEVYKSGDSFPAGDGCNNCGCENGKVSCTLIACNVE